MPKYLYKELLVQPKRVLLSCGVVLAISGVEFDAEKLVS